MHRTAKTVRRTTAGFTLTEMLVAGSIGTIVMAGVLTTYIHTMRAFHAISNYWEIHTSGRYAIERFAADMRAVYAVTAYSSNSQLRVTIPTSFYTTGAPASLKTVTYTYSSGTLCRTDSTDGLTLVLANNIYALNFRLYDRLGAPTTVLSVAKAAQLDMFLRKQTAGRAQTEDYLSARLDMRNKP